MVPPRSLDALRPYLTEDGRRRIDLDRVELPRVLAGRRVWMVNSTASGGGVSEMLRSLVGYARGTGVDARWIVVGGTPAFYAVTKRIHNMLHGDPGDGAGLGRDARRAYEAVLAANAAVLMPAVSPGDLVVLHDPQSAGLAPGLRRLGARVVWRCHVGTGTPNPLVREAWRFLLGYVDDAEALVFTRQSFVPEGLDGRVALIAPSIDPTTPKNLPMGAAAAGTLLEAAGIPLGRGPVVLHLSRWDRLKDPVGVLEAFAGWTAPRVAGTLVMAGPVPGSVRDDPEGDAVLETVTGAWRRLPDPVRGRVRIVPLPPAALRAGELLVNALQRRADVVVKKSLEEGFGLGITEALWKSKPVVAARAGGVQDQIQDGATGVLLDDPRDLERFGLAVAALLGDPARGRRLGEAGRERVRQRYLSDRSLDDWSWLVTGLL